MVVVIKCGDCLQLLSETASIDLILTDPPYGISVEGKKLNRGTGKFSQGSDITQDFGTWDRFPSVDAFKQFTTNWVVAADRTLRPGGMFISFFGYRYSGFLYDLLDALGYKDKGIFVHVKTNPVPQLRKVGFMVGAELVVMAQKLGGELTYNWRLGQRNNWLATPVVAGKKRFKHPTQKPEEITDIMVQYWTKEGDTVLDPFCGTGTSLVSAVKFGRNAIGFDTNADYCDIAQSRLELWINR